MALTTVVCMGSIVCNAQESAAPGGEALARETVALNNQPAKADAEIPEINCQKQVLAQQELARDVRNIRNPLPRPAGKESDLKRAFSRVLTGAGDLTNPVDIRHIQDYLAFSLLQITDPVFIEKPNQVQKLVEDTISSVDRAGSAIGNPVSQLAFRKAYCSEVLKVTKQLLKNNFDSRLAAIKIMGMLQEVKAVRGITSAKIYNDALVTLLDVLADPSQPDSVKVFTATSLRGVLQNCDVSPQDQFRICDAVEMELLRPCREAAYQMVLLDALMMVSAPRRTIGNPDPTVMNCFAAVLDDRNKPIEVRCHAALGVGRGAYDQQMAFDPLAKKIASLAGETAIEFNRNPSDPKWRECGHDLFFALHRQTQAEVSAPISERKGLLDRDPKSTVISDVAPLVSKVAQKLLTRDGEFSAEELKPLAMWIQAN